MEKMVRITICIEPETERLLRLLARRHSRSISELVRVAVEKHYSTESGKVEEVAKAEGGDPIRAVDPKAARLLDLATDTTNVGVQGSIDPTNFFVIQEKKEG